MNYDLDMPPYVDEMADWLDDDSKVHPCNGDNAYQGFEIQMGILRSVAERGQIAAAAGARASRSWKPSRRCCPTGRCCSRPR